MASQNGPDQGLALRARPDRRRRRAAGRRAQGIQDRRRRGHRSGQGRHAISARSPASAAPLRVKVSDDARKAIKAAKPDVVVLCTSSSLKKVLPQIEAILKLKVPIVSTTEELAYPTKGNMRYARAIHAAGEEGEGRGARHRRQPRVRDGRAADHADRRVRAGRGAAHRSHPGRAHPPAAVPAEDRRRADAASSSSRRSTTAACGTSGWPSRSR